MIDTCSVMGDSTLVLVSHSSLIKEQTIVRQLSNEPYKFTVSCAAGWSVTLSWPTKVILYTYSSLSGVI